MKLKALTLMAALAALTACGPTPTTDAIFKDASKYPPKPNEQTRAALNADAHFAEWVIFQAEQCKKHGCI